MITLTHPPVRLASALPVLLAVVSTFTLLRLGPAAARAANPAAVTGTVEGRVFNPRAGTIAENARVSVESASLVTFTDPDGNFRLSGVPAGSVQVRIFYTGFSPQIETVTLASGQTVQLEVTLRGGPPGAPGDGQVVTLDAFKVDESREMEAAAIAINEQRFASNVKTVVSTDEFGAVAEGNVAEFLRYLPGLTVDLSGGDARTVSIDGAPAENTPVTLGGLSLPSPTDTGRQVEVGFFNLNNISRVEVSMSPTPDSPGSALAGSVNLVPRSSFERTRPVYNLSVYAMMRDDMITFGKQPALYRDPRRVIHPGFDFSGVVPVNKRFGFSIAMGNSTQWSHQIGHTNTWRGLTAATNGNAFPHTTPDRPYLSAYQMTNAPKESRRESFGLTLDFRLSNYDRLSVSHQYSSFDGWTAARNIQFNPLQIASFSPATVQGVAGAGNIQATSGNGRVRENRIRMYTLNWRHDGPRWKLDAGFGHALGTDAVRSRDKGMFQVATARRTGVTVGFDQITQDRPGVITVTDNATGAPVDPHRLDSYSLISVAETPDRSSDVNLSAFGNVRRDFQWFVPVSLRSGLDFKQSTRDLRTGAFTWNYSGANVPGSAAPFLDVVAQREGPYGFPKAQFVDYKGVFDYFKANLDEFTLDENANYRARVNNSKYSHELISAAYLRADVALLNRRLQLVGGVRFEQTNIKAQGPLTDLTRNVQRDANGRPLLDAAGRPIPVTNDPLETSRLTLLDRAAHVKKEYFRSFPSLNASFNVRENLIARAAVSTAIGRPNFNQYSGGVSLPNTDNPPSGSNRIVVNNAGIKPWMATSYRVRLEYYFTGVGQFAVGAFRRDYENFFGAVVTQPTPAFLSLYGLEDEYSAYDVSTQYNLPGRVRMQGWDVSYKQALTFLPSWARGFQVFGNISFRKTSADDIGALGFNDIPHSGSWGVSFTRRRFNVRLNTSFRASQRQALVTGAGIEPGTFNYVPSRNTVDVLGEFVVWKRFAVFANLRNVGDVPNETVTEGPSTPDYALLRMAQRYGSLWTFGIKGTF